MSRIRRPYPSDLSDKEWALLKPLCASSERRGRPPKWPTRRVADAVFYLFLRSGCAWRMLPREYPSWQTVYYHFRRWRLDGRLRRAHDALRRSQRSFFRLHPRRLSTRETVESLTRTPAALSKNSRPSGRVAAGALRGPLLRASWLPRPAWASNRRFLGARDRPSREVAT
jgi:transposase